MVPLSRRTPRRPRTALVLGSGGIRTVAHLGLFKVLQRAGIPIDLVVGSSGGGLFGAAFALGIDPEGLQAWVEVHWKKHLFRDYGYSQLLKMLSPRLLHFDESFGILRGDSIRQVLGELYDGRTFADCKIPLHVVATDLQTGEAVVLHEGSLIEAVRASIAIPVLFQPHRVGGRWLVDGALCSPLPIEHAIAAGAEVIIAMGFSSQLYQHIDGPLRLVTQLMRISGNRLYRAELAYHARDPRVEVVPIEVDCEAQIGLRDAHAIPGLIAAGAEASEARIRTITRTLATFNSPGNRAKRQLRLSARRALRTAITELPDYGT
jgi:NTE family protein